ncbi:MAG: tetratricopeptide repeat protein, partial [Limisphaerales bacterium]
PAVFGICAFLVVAVWIVFGQTLGFEFVNYDDNFYVYENPEVIQGLSLKGIGWALTHSVAANWHPLTVMSHMLDCQLYGLHAGGHHLTSLLLHAATAILLFLVLREMTGALWRSAFVAAVFAIHPLRVESVAWVSERKDVLSGLFFMLTLGAYVRYVRRPPSWGRYLTVLFLFALGLMCKPMLVTMPFVLLLLDYWPLNRFGAAANGYAISRKLIIEKIPFIVFSIAICVVTVLVQQPDKEISLFLRVSNTLVSCVAYCGQMFYPVGLALLYPFPINGVPVGEVILALLLLVAVTVIAFCGRQKRPYFLMGWLWYLGMLVPVIGLVQVGSQARADRYTYLPQIGLYILLTWTVIELTASWRSRRWVLGVGAMTVLAVLITCASAQTAYWCDSESLWTHTLACTPDNSTAHNKLGNAFLKQGRMEEAMVHYQQALAISPDEETYDNLGYVYLQQGKTGDATVQFQKALEINPNYTEAYYNLGNALLQQGNVEEAVACYQKALKINPDDAKVYNNLGSIFRQQGRPEEAIAQVQKALEINPNYAEVHNNLGVVFTQQGRREEAISQFQKALTIEPDYAEAHYNLGNALFQQGNVEEAIAQFQKALEIKPDYVAVQNNMAWVLATCPQASLRNGIEAVKLAERANQLTGGQNPVILCTLAASYAEAGRSAEAIETAQHALQLATVQSNTALIESLQSQIKSYQAGIPSHSTGQAQ